MSSHPLSQEANYPGVRYPIRLDQYGLDRCSQQDQMFTNWKRKLVSSIYTSCISSTLVLASVDHIAKAMFQIQETLANVMEGSVMEPQERDSIRMGLLSLNVLGKQTRDPSSLQWTWLCQIWSLQINCPINL